MRACLAIGLGGALGAICRYLLSLIPVRGAVPWMTMLTNLLGAILIGMVVGLATLLPDLPADLLFFLKTGFCGGFTTFSTFSLEMLKLLEDGHLAAAMLYACLSVVLCIAGVWLGRELLLAAFPSR